MLYDFAPQINCFLCGEKGTNQLLASQHLQGSTNGVRTSDTGSSWCMILLKDYEDIPVSGFAASLSQPCMEYVPYMVCFIFLLLGSDTRASSYIKYAAQVVILVYIFRA